MAMQELQLAVFSGKLHGILAFLASPRTGPSFLADAEPDYIFDYDDDKPHFKQQVIEAQLQRPNVPVRRKPLRPEIEELIQAISIRHCGRLIRLQNYSACSFLSRKTPTNLQSLTLYMWDIMSPDLPKLLASHFPELQELRLGLCHPYINDPSLPLKYWVHPDFLEPTPIWDAFGGIGEEHAANLRLKTLKKLILQRSGINRTQLQKWIECNPGLVDLRLHHVAGVDAQFVQWLGAYHRSDAGDHVDQDSPQPAKLKTLALERCASLTLGSLNDLTWLDSILDIPGEGDRDQDKASTFQVLSFRDSTSVSSSALLQYLALKQPRVRQVILPDSRVLVETTTDPDKDGEYDTGVYSCRAYTRSLQGCDQPSPVPYLRFRSFPDRPLGAGILEADPRCC